MAPFKGDLFIFKKAVAMALGGWAAGLAAPHPTTPCGTRPTLAFKKQLRARASQP
jgi:hypothetical protein